MESVTDNESQEANESVDRIVLRRTENDRLQAWATTLNARFDGMIRVTKSDLANFLIRQHEADLSEDEINLIETEMFDEVRWLNWALTKVRQAKKAGESLSLNDLIIRREAIKERNRNPNRRLKARRHKTPQGADKAPVESGGPEET